MTSATPAAADVPDHARQRCVELPAIAALPVLIETVRAAAPHSLG